ncbi:MAG: hypothetical protein KGY81_07545 [Phycisphaerae bacterium]|nr:hypothetical protein [Phycisphaerae bacterium]
MVRIVVVGDAMVDDYRYLSRSRRRDPNSRDGEVIYNDRGEFNRRTLGGAAAVAYLIRAAYRHDVRLVSSLGDDEEGRIAMARLDAADIDTCLYRQGQTTRKTRFVQLSDSDERPEQVWTSRIDRDSQVRLPYVERHRLGDALLSADLIVVVDHAKGLMRSLLPALQRATSPILVDPSAVGSWADYGRVDLIKATRAELADRVPERYAMQGATAHINAVRHLAANWIVTAGAHGLYYSQPNGDVIHHPAHPVDSIVDTGGCGDTVMACAAVGWIHGVSMPIICQRATRAAALQATHVGVSPEVMVEA